MQKWLAAVTAKEYSTGTIAAVLENKKPPPLGWTGAIADVVMIAFYSVTFLSLSVLSLAIVFDHMDTSLFSTARKVTAEAHGGVSGLWGEGEGRERVGEWERERERGRDFRFLQRSNAC